MIEKIKSGIEGLDSLLSGGIPKGRSFLVAGEPGTGKTIFSLQFLLEGVNEGKKALYITIDEKPEHLIADAQALGWDLMAHLESGMLQILDVTSYFSSTKLGETEGVDIDKITDDIIAFVRNHAIERLAIDPIAPLVFSGHGTHLVVEYIRRLIFLLESDWSCTTLLTSYVPVGSEKISLHGIEEFASSGIILLRLTPINHKYVRTIRIRKMRGTRIDLSEYSFEILPQRGVVLRQALG
jgi:circadian clock protein KaiC